MLMISLVRYLMRGLSGKPDSSRWSICFDHKGVYTKTSRSKAIAKTDRPPIGVRRVDVNKGDDEDPNYRSRLVAKDFRRKGDDSIFAPTPPLEALRSPLMMAATSALWIPAWLNAGPERRIHISFIDIWRAYFHAQVDEGFPIFVELLPEDNDYGKDLCGQLRVHMYGNRLAAEGWHTEYSGTMQEFGFHTGVSSACVFPHVICLRHLSLFLSLSLSFSHSPAMAFPLLAYT